MKNKINKTPKWHFPPELPRSKESGYSVYEMPVTVILPNGVEENVTYLTFGGMHFYDTDNWSVGTPIAWKYKHKEK